MFDFLKVRRVHGYQAIPDVRKAVLDPAFRGFPELDQNQCPEDCSLCRDLCPTKAIKLHPLRIDLGTCVLCGDCAKQCPGEAIRFTNQHRIAADMEAKLIVQSGMTFQEYRSRAIRARKEINSIFGRSLKLRQVSAGGCNGCEMELGACTNVNFDMGRFGIEWVASPRHADGIVISGPISENMASALEDTYQATPAPKIIILAGTCAISGGVFSESEAIDRSFLKKYPVDLYLPGCPVHPLTVVEGILDLIRKPGKSFS